MFRLIAAAMLVLSLAVPNAWAAPITSFSGTTSPILDGGGGFPIVNSTSVQLGGLSINGLGFPLSVLAPANQLTDGALTFSTTATPNQATVTPASISFSVPNTGFVTPFGTLAGGTVTFDVVSTPIGITGGGTSYTFGSLSDDSSLLTLTGNTSGLDFGPLGSAFRFQASTQGITYSGGPNGVFNSTGIPSGSFTANLAPPVPEPATLAVWGALALGGAWYGRRRFLKPQPKAEA